MACCKCCCGGENCTEGQQGKCCCGGPSGTCCQPGEYCCSGACQSTPCSSSGACCLPDRCTVEADVDFSGTEYEGGPFPTPSGWTQIAPLVPEFPNIIPYIHVIPDTEPCDDQSQYFADLLTAYAGWADGLSLPIGSFAFSSVAQQAASCQDSLTQSSCESQGGTWNASKTCAEITNTCTAVYFALGDPAFVEVLNQWRAGDPDPCETAYGGAGWLYAGFGTCQNVSDVGCCGECQFDDRFPPELQSGIVCEENPFP